MEGVGQEGRDTVFPLGGVGVERGGVAGAGDDPQIDRGGGGGLDVATATWTHASGTRRWVRAEKWSPHLIENEGQVAADNVVVLIAVRDTSFARAKPGMTILDVFDASGTLQLFTGDKVVAGRWTKGDVNDPFTFATADGKPLLLTPGKTWIECAPTSTPITITSGP